MHFVRPLLTSAAGAQSSLSDLRGQAASKSHCWWLGKPFHNLQSNLSTSGVAEGGKVCKYRVLRAMSGPGPVAGPYLRIRRWSNLIKHCSCLDTTGHYKSRYAPASDV